VSDLSNQVQVLRFVQPLIAQELEAELEGTIQLEFEEIYLQAGLWPYYYVILLPY
tara:strand:- start:390 stop:554 length:165 start_codon:yes stop_codon:yes gene_type:complete